MDSLETISTKKNKKLFSEHRWIADALYFEGPLLSLFKGSKEQDYFYYWCESDAVINRWLVIPVSRDNLDEYFSGSKSLLTLIEANNYVDLVDTDTEGGVSFAHSLKSSDLPGKYLPAETSFFDADLCPTDIYKSIKATVYGINIDKKWFFDEFSLVERVFTQLYVFMYGLKNVGGLVAREKIQSAYQQYPWKGGFSAVHFYEKLRAVIPSLHEPKVHSINFASPGTIKLELLESVASSTGNLIAHFGENSAAILNTYEEARKYLRHAGLLKIPDEELNIDNVLSEGTKAEIANHFKELAKKLNIDEFSDEIEILTGNPLISLKILLSFCRRIMKLNTFQMEGKITFKGNIAEI